LSTPGLSSAFNVGGSNNIVESTGGPLSVAGGLGVNNHNGTTFPSITQSGTGFNVKTPLNK